MNEAKAAQQTIEIFGEDSFAEFDDAGGIDRYYVGALPKTPGPYIGFMGFTYEQALGFAKNGNPMEKADQIASELHDLVYREPFDRKAASDLVWQLHGLLRAKQCLDHCGHDPSNVKNGVCVVPVGMDACMHRCTFASDQQVAQEGGELGI